MNAIHLEVHRWTGKALGAAAGLVFAPAAPAALVWWLVGGLALGHTVDLVAAHLAARSRPRVSARPDTQAPAAVRFAFAALGRLAAESGNAGPEHVHQAERLMARLGHDANRRRESLVWFCAGQDSSFPFDTVAAAARNELAAHPVLRELAVSAMCRMCALADAAPASRALLELGELIGVDRDTMARQSVAAAAMMPVRTPEQRACDALGVAPDDSREVIRLAYRRRVARWHPDRLGPDATEEERSQAERRMWQLREALETLLAAQST